jgi:DNA transposition AAA+ family ATPase
MHKKFVKTSNVRVFLEAVSKASPKNRAARETAIVLATGKPGLGKTGCGEWWATHNDAIFVRLKSACTPKWVLSDLVTELNKAPPASTSHKLFNQAVGMMAANPRPIVVDEIEHAMANIKTLEALRDLSDTVGCTLVFMGREHVPHKIKKFPQFETRLIEAATFSPAPLDDVRKLCDELCEVRIDDDLVQAIHLQTKGVVREILKAIKLVETVGLRRPDKVMNLQAMEGRELVIDLYKRAA